MKFGVRKPSLNKRIAARTSLKRYARHNLGLKAPRGMGWVTNPKKAAYNRVYNRTSFSVDKLFGKKGGDVLLAMLLVGAIVLAFNIIVFVVKGIASLISGNKNQGQYRDVSNAEMITISNNSTPCCPRCSRPMVKRIAKRGRHVGHEFWGCHSFPSCRGTRTVTY